MGVVERILGYMTAPFVGERYDRKQVITSDYNVPRATGLPLSQLQRYDVPGDTLANRSQGTHNLIPGFILSAQTRMKNQQYEFPATGFTKNPESPPWVVNVPGLPKQYIKMNTVNSFSTQPMYLSPIANLEIQNRQSMYNRLRAAVLGEAASSDMSSSEQIMFPSIYNGTA